MKYPICFVFFLSIIFCQAQEECFLGMGGKNDEDIVEVFQLDELQREKMANWSAELKVRNDILKDQAKYLLKKNVDGSPEQLMEISYQYRTLLDSMRQNLRMLDTRLLSIFNDSQYNLYIELCQGVSMRPIYVDRSVGEK